MNITFLTYSSRSVSTFLAHQVSKHLDVVVVPEFQFLYRVLHVDPELQLGHNRVRELIASDRQLSWFGVEDLNQLGEGAVDVAALTSLVLQKYAESQGQDSDDFLVKLGGILHLWPDVQRHFPGAKALDISRDARGVVNSLCKATSPYLGADVPMGYGDVWWATRRWVRDVEAGRLRHAEQPDLVYRVRYQDVVEDPAHTVQDVADFFAWRPRTSQGATFAVLDAEAQIHPLAGKPAEMSRLEGWRDELQRRDRLVVETLARHELAREGFTDVVDVPRRERWTALGLAYGQHLKLQAVHSVRRLGRVRSRQELMDKTIHALKRRSR